MQRISANGHSFATGRGTLVVALGKWACQRKET